MTSTDKDYAAAAEWAERDMRLPENSATALRGEPAAAYGRPVGARAGSRRTAVHRPGRRTGRALPGTQVRLPQALNAEPDAVAQQQHRTASEVLRDAVAEYLATRHAS